MAVDNHLDAGPRRVWRMTANAPAGEYLDLVPKEAASKHLAPHGALPPHKAVQSGLVAKETSQPGVTPLAPPVLAPAGEVLAEVMSAAPKVKVLRPAQVESWQASSFDLLTGCKVRDVT